MLREIDQNHLKQIKEQKSLGDTELWSLTRAGFVLTIESQQWVMLPILMSRNKNSKKTWKCCCSGCLIAQEGKDGIYILNISLDKYFLLKKNQL